MVGGGVVVTFSWGMNYFMVMVWSQYPRINFAVAVDLCSKFDCMHLIVHVLMLATEDLELYFMS